MDYERYLPEGRLIHTEKNRMLTGSLAGLQRACREGTILEGRVMRCDAAHNLIVDLEGCPNAVIPRDEAAIGIASGQVREIAIISRVGKPVCFKVTGFERNGEGVCVLLSRRMAQQAALHTLMDTLFPGQVIPARVTRLERFGAFVDIGCGNISLIGVENISVSRIAHPSRRFTPGQDIFAAVLSVDGANCRVTQSTKELLGDWCQNAADFTAGETVSGVVRSVESYGAFIELAPNLSGLAERSADIAEGSIVSVYIKSIIPERMKIKLVVIEALGMEERPAPFRYFITDGRLDYWRYSPPNCGKVIETFFDGC